MTARHRLIIDTDPGIDDAIAILLAGWHPDIELVGLTTVFGNVSVEQATSNAGFLQTLLPRRVPVARGAAVPLVQPAPDYPDFVHGKHGFGDRIVAAPADFAPVDEDAAAFIVREVMAHPGEITLVPVGPFTNIAAALKLCPEIVKNVKNVVVMGGAARKEGNVNAFAEANIWNDPHAAKIVFDAGWPVTMVGLDVTHKTVMPETRMEDLVAHAPKVGEFLAEITRYYGRFYRSRHGFEGFSVHDPATVVQVLHPELFTTERGRVEVIVDGEQAGRTVFTAAAPGSATAADNATVCLQVNGPAVLQVIEDTLRRAD